MSQVKGFDSLGRPNWDLYYMNLAISVSLRSFDTSTKCGCVFVSEDYTPLSFGYNSPPSGMNDKDVPLTRPDKYSYFIHAELNAIYNAAKNGISLKNSIMYITGTICSKCILSVLSIRPKRVVEGPILPVCCNQEDAVLREQILAKSLYKLNIEKFNNEYELYALNNQYKYYVDKNELAIVVSRGDKYETVADKEEADRSYEDMKLQSIRNLRKKKNNND